LIVQPQAVRLIQAKPAEMEAGDETVRATATQQEDRQRVGGHPTIDLTEWDRREAEELSPMVQSLTVMLRELSDAIVLVDMDGRCLFANPTFDALLGHDALSSAGNGMSPAWIALEERAQWELLLDLHRSERAHVLGLLTVNSALVRLNGERILVSVTSDRLLGDDGLAVAVLFLVRHRVGDRLNSAAETHIAIKELWDVVDGLKSRLVERPHSRSTSMLRSKSSTPQAEQPASKSEGRKEASFRDAQPAEFDSTRAEQTASLTAREQEILEQILRGLRVATIAGKMFLSEHTVRNHLKSIHRKLGMHSTAEIREALQYRGNGEHT
jgi:DNA-binding CsgD family transcriptional regulator/PAS domain-containing protein